MVSMSQSPLIFVIFGATGDLMHRKLMPALYHLIRNEDIAGYIYCGRGKTGNYHGSVPRTDGTLRRKRWEPDLT